MNMDPDEAFGAFCKESGFSVAHGMSADASVINKPNRKDRVSNIAGGDLFASPNMPFVPAGDAFLSRIETSAVGAMLVLLSLIGAIGFGGY